MIIQIYETQSAAEAMALAKLGVDHIGVLVGNGEFPREFSIDQAREIFTGIPVDHYAVALSLSSDLAFITHIADELQPPIFHLGAAPEGVSPNDIRTLKQRFPQIHFMRSIPVTGPESIDLAKSYDGVADYLLLDSYKANDKQVGATGQVHDWLISKAIVQAVSIPVILAGGLGPDNVADAIRQILPAGVDSKTKTDITGRADKDLEKVKQFVYLARQAL